MVAFEPHIVDAISELYEGSVEEATMSCPLIQKVGYAESHLRRCMCKSFVAVLHVGRDVLRRPNLVRSREPSIEDFGD